MPPKTLFHEFIYDGPVQTMRRRQWNSHSRVQNSSMNREESDEPQLIAEEEDYSDDEAEEDLELEAMAGRG